MTRTENIPAGNDRPERGGRGRAIAILLSAAGVVVSVGFVHALLPARTWKSVEVHSLIEGVGAAVAVCMAFVLLLLRKSRADLESFVWAAAGFLSAGIFSLFHAAAVEREGFVWLHSASVLVSGAFFALVVLPERFARTTFAARLAWVAGGLALVLGCLTFFRRDFFPLMVEGGAFTPAAKTMNVAGGLLFLAAGTRHFRRHLARGLMLDGALSWMCLLFAMAGLSFSFSRIWVWDWWLWHFVRFAAYGVAAVSMAEWYLELLAERRRAAEWVQTVLGAAIDGYWIADSRGIVLDVSDAYCRSSGYAREEILGRRIQDLMAGEAPGEVEARLENIVRSGHDRFVTRHRFKDGRLVDFETSVNCVAHEGGRLVGFVRDITERALAEAALRESEERYRILFDRANEGIFLLSTDGSLLSVNESFARMHGYSPEEMGRMSLKDLDTPDTARLVPERMRRLQAGESLTFEVEHYHRNGQVIPLEVSASLISVRGRSIVQSFHRDITERRRAEEEKGKLQAQLTQAQKMEIAGRVVGGVVHDFNNLLTAIMSAVHLLSPLAAREPGIQPVLDELGMLAKRGSRLTHQLLSFVRKQDNQPQVMDLNAAVTDIQKMLRRLIGEDVELELSLSTGLGFVCADPGHIEQILMNLAVNARDAMPEGGRLTIRTANEDVGPDAGIPTGPYVTLSVTDTGCGMEPEILAHLFEPLFTTKPSGKGTGLGLPTVLTIVQQHSGHIGVESAPGRGSTFRIRLPRVHVPALEAPPPGPAPAAIPGHGTVLLVEDEDIVRNGVRETLQHLGYTVLDARNGPEALDLYRRRNMPIQMLITDVIMPRMTGPELAGELSRLGSGARVLYVSGYTDDAVAQAGLRDPGASFLQKPFSPEALAARVRQILSGKPPGIG